MTSPLQALGIVPPRWFPCREHDETNRRVGESGSTERAVWRAFASAWNAVEARSRRAEAIAAELRKAWVAGPNAPPEDRYREDHLLLELASSIVSAVECNAYALYCLLSILDDVAFPLASSGRLRQVSLIRLVEWTRTGPAFARAVCSCAERCELEIVEIRQLRDFLSHRGQIPRQAHLSNWQPVASTIPANPKDLPDSWSFSTELSVASVDRWHGTLVGCVQSLMTTAHSLSALLPRPTT